jgi:hypothetical protein
MQRNMPPPWSVVASFLEIVEVNGSLVLMKTGHKIINTTCATKDAEYGWLC